MNMIAKDLMTVRVITVLEDTPVEEVASVLLKWRISAVPVVSTSGKVVGIVSEGDLMRRAESGTVEEGAWWLSDFLNAESRAKGYARAYGRLAKDVMSSPVITADAEICVADLARLLEKNRIKRVSIISAGKLVGIVSRANLLHAIAATSSADAEESAENQLPIRAQVRPGYSDDQVIRATVLNTLHNDVRMGAAVNVIVSQGVVDLWGGVETEAERQAVRAVAEGTPNVIAVEDHLTVLPAAIRHLLGADRGD